MPSRSWWIKAYLPSLGLVSQHSSKRLSRSHKRMGLSLLAPISSAAGLSSIGDYVFRAGLAVDILTPVGLMTTQEKLGYTKVATIYDAADAYSTSSNEEIVKALEAGGVEILTQETFQTGDTDFSTQLTNIMKMEPDAVFVAALSVEMVQIITQAREVGISNVRLLFLI